MRTLAYSSAIIALSSLLGCSATEYQYFDASSKHLSFVLQLSTPGATTPYKNFHKTLNPEEDPKIDNFLTPLGQRQQFLIGTELRLRYVHDAMNFLNHSYDISQIWIQSTFDQKSILSAQAQLLGIYPPFTSANYLTEWQQQNAVPPLIPSVHQEWEPYFKQWQSELGDKALLDNINTFPINMVGHDDDYMLRLNSENCPAWSHAIQHNHGALHAFTEQYEEFLVRLAQLFGQEEITSLDQAGEMCQYLQWADLHNVELTIKYTEDDLKQCAGFEGALIKYYQYVDTNLNYISSADFIEYLDSHLSSIAGKIQYKQTSHFRRFQLRNEQSSRPEQLYATNAGTQPNYVFLMTEPTNMMLFLQALTRDSSKFAVAPIPSSTLFFEVSTDKNGLQTISAHYNDEYIQLGGCDSLTACPLSVFQEWLETNLKIADTKAACSVITQTEFLSS